MPADQGDAAPRACTENLGSVVTQSRDLTDTNGAYCFGDANTRFSDTTIAAGVTVTVHPGVQLVGHNDSSLTVSGTLVFSGTADQPAVLTARSGVTPTQGRNYSVFVKGQGRIEFRRAEMWYAGRCNNFLAVLG